MRWAWTTFAILLALAPPARAAPVDRDRLAYFLGYSAAHRNEPRQATPPQLWESRLFAAARDNGARPEPTLTAFAAAIDAEPEDAEAYAGLLIDAVAHNRGCDRDGYAACDEAVFLARMREAVWADPSGQVLMALATPLYSARMQEELLRIAGGHPAFRDLAPALYDAMDRFAVLETALEHGAVSGRLLEYVFLRDRPLINVPLDREETFRRLLDSTPPGPEAAGRRVLAAALLARRLVQTERPADARALIGGLAEEDQARFWSLLSTISPQGPMVQPAGVELMFDLAAAEAAAGRTAEAREILERYDGPRGFGASAPFNKAALLEEMLDPSLSDEEIYNLMIFGAPDVSWRVGGGLNPGGLMFSLRSETTDYRRLAAGYLRAARYPRMADAVDPDAPSPQSAAPTPTTRTRPEHLIERDLSPWVTASTAESEYDFIPAYRAEIPDGIEPPVPPRRVARLDHDGDRVTVIYESGDVDAVDVFANGGYWMTLSEDGGARWSDPVYLGFQHRYPYIVLPGSDLPVWEGDTLRLEVERVEFERPQPLYRPMGGNYPPFRTRRGLYVELDWTALTADSDGDGLTDLLERRVGLDPANADTDSDGADDRADRLPFTSPIPGDHAALMQAITDELFAPREREAAPDRAALELMHGGPEGLAEFERQQARAAAFAPRGFPSVKVAAAAPGLLAGVETEQRVLVYDGDVLAKLDPAFGEFVPARLDVFMTKDGEQAYVGWHTGWSGRTFLIRRDGDGWEVAPLSNYVI